MHRLVPHSAGGKAVILVCLSLASCLVPDAASFETSLTRPRGLRIEQHALRDGPDLEPLTFVPVQGTQEEVLSKHRRQRAASPRSPCHADCEATLAGQRLTATTYVTDTAGGERVIAEVSQDGEVIHSLEIGDPCAISPLWGLWTYDDHWVLEAAGVKARHQSGAIICDATGKIVQDGLSLNEQQGYQESFGFQLMDGRPFYVFKRRGRWGISYDGHEVPLRYRHITHYQCCSGSVLNLRSSPNMVAFFAERDGVRYYVEAGVFE